MSHSYAQYTEILINALKFNPKSQDLIEKKQEIVKSIAGHYASNVSSMLFIGFSPLILCAGNKQVFVSHITDEIKNYLDSAGIKYTHVEDDLLPNYKKQFSWVVAGEEYFTFAESEDHQRDAVELLTSLAKDLVVTTLRDYKNQEFKDREFSQPLAVHNHGKNKLYVEYHDYDYSDKNSWKTMVYELEGTQANIYGPFARRSMFFKQLAKFSIDAGAKNFYVHKNLMYKSLIKKNYEHVISISF